MASRVATATTTATSTAINQPSSPSEQVKKIARFYPQEGTARSRLTVKIILDFLSASCLYVAEKGSRRPQYHVG
jgi:hypothetical protein